MVRLASLLLLVGCTTDVSLNLQQDPACGNARLDDGETCDDGNDVDTDACTNACEEARCGDRIVQDGVEACDDGNDIDTDACLTACVEATCGDGVVRQDIEDCDEGPANATPDGTCFDDCTAVRPPDLEANVRALDAAGGFLRDPVKLTVEDLDQDARPDLVVQIETFDSPLTLPPATGLVRVMNDGTGVLHPPRQIQDQLSQIGLSALADFDGDGHQDLLLPGDWSDFTDTLVLFRGSPDGFLAGEQIDTEAGSTPPSLGGRGPRNTLLDDLNGDGDVDVVVLNASDASDLTVLLGDGSGGLTPVGQYTLPDDGSPREGMLADVTGDGDDDLVITQDFTGDVTVLPRTGAVTFGAAQTVELTDFAAAIAPFDFDHDDDAEIIVQTFSSSTATVVDWVGDAPVIDGTLSLRGFNGGDCSASNASSPAVADMDGDGRDDVLFDCSRFVQRVTHGSGPDDPVVETLDCPDCGVLSPGNRSMSGVALGDLDRDGFTDGVATWQNGEFAVFWGDADGPGGLPYRFQAGRQRSFNWFSFGVALGDVDRDGFEDLVGVSLDGPYMLPGVPNRRVVTPGAMLSRDLLDTTTMNLGPGSEPDILGVGGRYNPTPVFNDPYALEGVAGPLGRVLYATRELPDTADPVAVAAGPLDGDASDDFVYVSDAEDLYVLNFGSGDGTFGSTDTLPTISPGINQVWVLDADGDRVNDLFGMDPRGGVFEARRGRGDGTFDPPVVVTAGPGGAEPADLAVVDLDGDDRGDLIWVNRGTAQLVVSLASDGFGWGDPVFYDIALASGQAEAVAVGDIDGDGRPDVAVAATDGVHLRIGFGNGALAGEQILGAGVDPRDIVAADFDGDGRDDLVVANHGSDDLTVFRATTPQD